MDTFIDSIEKLLGDNTNFRQVLYTSQHLQLVVMNLKPGEEIGEEVHEIVDQFLKIEEGSGKIIANGQEKEIKAGDAIIVPAGTKHNIVNTSPTEPLKLYTLYSPPHHKAGTVHTTKEEAIADHEDHI